MGFLLRISTGLGGLAIVAITCALFVGTTRHPDANWIVYISSRSRSNSYDINRINPDGSQVERLAVVIGSVPTLLWSPDGTRLAVISHLDRDALTVMDIAGRSQHLLVNSVAEIQSAAWSPDGEWIAYAASAAPAGGEPSYLYRVSAHGGASTQLTTASTSSATETLTYSNLSWSPDGRALIFDAFTPQDTSRRSVYRVDAGGGEPSLVVEGCCAGWSPDGDWIAYVAAGQDGQRHLYRIPAVGGQPEQLIENALEIGGPVSWSPDGAWLVFVAFDGQNTRTLYRVRADGSRLEGLVSGTLQAPVSWSPDGEWLVFPMFGTASVSFQPGIYRVRADGRDLELLTAGSGIAYFPLWSPALESTLRLGLLALLGGAMLVLSIVAHHGLPPPHRVLRL